MAANVHYRICLVGAMAALFVAVANYFSVPHPKDFMTREALTIAVALLLLVVARASKAKMKAKKSLFPRRKQVITSSDDDFEDRISG